jgi:type I restriction enzyme M protein
VAPFRWETLPEPLLRRLGKEIGHNAGEPAADLRRTYGDRPGGDFVRDLWRVLRDEWLAADRERRRPVVEALWELGVGKGDDRPHGPAAEMEFLRSCRNARRLRETVLAHFIRAGEESRAGTPSGGARRSPSPPTAAAAEPRPAPQPVRATQARSPLTQQELERRLWDAANALRGPVDPSDFKAYVFPLLFLKRISDTWDAEYARALEEFGDDETAAMLPENYRFQVPDDCHWSDLRKASENVGVKLQLILDRIQEANPVTLAGIFGAVAWGDKERLPEHALVNLIKVFDATPLDPATVDHDMLGNAYEYLLREFAEASGKKAGEFFTPRAVVRLLTRLLDPQPADTIYDPACGSGGMLVEAVNEVREAGGDVRTLRLYGQEVNLTTGAIARMNLFMHDIEDFRILRGDTLREPKFYDSAGHLSTYDVVIANPPFSLKNWGAEAWSHDPWQRSFCGAPPAGNGDFAWVQHMIRSMRSRTGRVGVVMPHGVLFRGGQEAAIRQCLVQGDLLESVIGLAPNLFYSTSIPACLLVFRDAKPRERKGQVLFVDASNRFAKGRNQNQLTPEDVESVLTAYRTATGLDGDGGPACRLVEVAEIKENGWDLNIGRYITGLAAQLVDVPTALAQLAKAQESLWEAEVALADRLQAAGYA